MQVNLKVLRGKSAGKEIPIPIASFLIGRSDDCHLRPKSDAISRRHCELTTEDGQVWVQDLGSRNGTIVNGVKIAEKTELSSGDTLKVGKLAFEISIVQPAADDAFDVSDWLESEDETHAVPLADPETRQFELDETQQGELRRAAEPSEPVDDAEADSQQAIPDASDEDSVDDTTGFFLGGRKKNEKNEKKEKPKKPGKLPQKSGPSSADSTSAAADALKNFFNNRS